MAGCALPVPDTWHPPTLIAGLKKRLLTKVGHQDFNVVRRLDSFVQSHFINTLQPVDSVLTFEEWLNQTKYTKKTKQKLRVLWYETLCECSPSSGSTWSKFFGKLERYPEFKHARGINGCSESEKVFVGPVIKSIEHAFYHQYAQNLVKGLPTQRKALALSSRLLLEAAMFAGTDFSNFEGSVSRMISRVIEIPFLKRMLGGRCPEVLRYICSKLMSPHKLSGKYFDCRVSGIRCSGDMWTSLLNSVVNLVLIKFCCYELGWNAEPIVEGDDGLFRLDGPCPTPDQFDSLGFSVKIDKFRTIGEAGFCKMKFDANGVQVTDPIERLVKFGWTSHVHATAKQRANLLYTKALSLKAEYPGCPMLGPYADFIIRSLQSENPRLRLAFDEDPGWTARKIEMAETWISQPSRITDDTRLFFEKLYGISVIEQQSFEAQYCRGAIRPIDSDIILSRCPRSWFINYDRFCTTKRYCDW